MKLPTTKIFPSLQGNRQRGDWTTLNKVLSIIETKIFLAKQFSNKKLNFIESLLLDNHIPTLVVNENQKFFKIF